MARRNSRAAKCLAIAVPALLVVGAWLYSVRLSRQSYREFVTSQRALWTNIALQLLASGVPWTDEPCELLNRTQPDRAAHLFYRASASTRETLESTVEYEGGRIKMLGGVDWVAGYLFDAWGNKTRVVILSDDCRHAELISCGANGLFENGAGDDIVEPVHVRGLGQYSR